MAYDLDDLDLDEFRPMSFADALNMAETGEDFVIDGLITTGATLLYGEPNAGKSLMAAGIVASLVTGEPFLGREVKGTRKVAVCWSDDRAPAEYGKRITPLLPEGSTDDVMFYCMPIMRSVEQWQRLYDQVTNDGCDFVIFDVMTQIIDGDANDGPPVAKFFDGVRRFTRDGIPALVITHSSEKSGEGGRKSDKPMGNTTISGFARWNIFLSRNKGGMWTASCFGKWADSALIQFYGAEGFNVPRFRVAGEKDGEELRGAARQRSASTLDKRAETARWIAANCQGLHKRAAAEKAAQALGLTASTLQRELSDGTYKALLDYRDRNWILL